jgi:hypothetical protein
MIHRVLSAGDLAISGGGVFPCCSQVAANLINKSVLLRWQRNWGRRRSWRGPRISGGRRRWWGITWTDLHWPPGVADDPAIRIKDGLGCPIAIGPIERLGIAWIDHIAGWSRGKDRASHDRATDHTGSNTCANARAAPARTSAPAPSTSSPLRRGIGRRGRQGGGSRYSRQRGPKGVWRSSDTKAK